MKAAMKEAHIDISKIGPINIPDLLPGTHAYDPEKKVRISNVSWRSSVVISKPNSIP